MSVSMRYRVSWYEGAIHLECTFSNLSDAFNCFRSRRSLPFVDRLVLRCID